VRVRHGLNTVLLAALAFGLAVAWIKGQDTDGRTGLAPLRGVLGNLSAPWLLLPFWAGLGRRPWWRAAATGLAATLVALLAFYAFTGLVADLDGRSFPADVPLWVRANRAYLEAGVLAGPVCGTLGSWWSRARRPRLLTLIGLLLVAEPASLAALGLLRPVTRRLVDVGLPGAVRLVSGWGIGPDASTQALVVYAVEAAAGVALLVSVRLGQRAVRRSGA
jgi:hypothetical protein